MVLCHNTGCTHFRHLAAGFLRRGGDGRARFTVHEEGRWKEVESSSYYQQCKEKMPCYQISFYDGPVCHEIERNCSFWSVLIFPEIKRSWCILMKKNGPYFFFPVTGGVGDFRFLVLCFKAKTLL